MTLDKVSTFRVDSRKWDTFVRWCEGFRVKPQDIIRRLVSEIVHVRLEDMVYPTDWFDIVDDELIGPGQESCEVYSNVDDTDDAQRYAISTTLKDIGIKLPPDYYHDIENNIENY